MLLMKSEKEKRKQKNFSEKRQIGLSWLAFKNKIPMAKTLQGDCI